MTPRKLLTLARALTIYGLLVGGSIVFSLPFLWMIGTSMKVDREMFGETITFLPQTPVPAPVSPYFDTRYFDPPPNDRVRAIRDIVAPLLAQRPLDLPPSVQDPQDVLDNLADGLARRLYGILPVTLWRPGNTLDLRAEIESRLTPDLILDTASRAYRQLAFGSVRVRSLDLQERELFTDTAPTDFWTLHTSASAEFREISGNLFPQALLAYDLRHAPRAPITLTRSLHLPFAADRLHRVQISIQPDDSWHRVDFFLEKNGVRYQTLRPLFLGDFQTTVAVLQEFGPDDALDSTRIRLWYPYREIDRSPAYEARPDHVKVDLLITPGTQTDAWWAKIQRNYRSALNYIPFWRYFATSAFLVILNIIGNIFSCSLVAYAFARLHWPGRNFAFALMMATLMIPPQVTMIPYFLIIKHLGWYNTLNPLWVISFFGNAFNIFLLRQFMKGIPRDLEDAARIDGCNFLQVYWHVIMPLIKPTLACIAIFTFMGVWNDFMGPLIYLSDQRLYPLSLGLYALNVQEGGNFGMMMAGAFMMTLPVIIIFFFAQKYFIQGVTLTGMKG